mmetsp:Transcript_94933/g.268397  ORF Transcript_94933/g.268397 Transcript_94933/m.268397 type:complete len:304 (-) Transcript_94933:431-1342(-)
MALWRWPGSIRGAALPDNGTLFSDGSDGDWDAEYRTSQAVFHDIDAKVSLAQSPEPASFATVENGSCPLEAERPGLLSSSRADRHAPQTAAFPEAHGFHRGVVVLYTGFAQSQSCQDNKNQYQLAANMAAALETTTLPDTTLGKGMNKAGKACNGASWCDVSAAFALYAADAGVDTVILTLVDCNFTTQGMIKPESVFCTCELPRIAEQTPNATILVLTTQRGYDRVLNAAKSGGDLAKAGGRKLSVKSMQTACEKGQVTSRRWILYAAAAIAVVSGLVLFLWRKRCSLCRRNTARAPLLLST